MSQEYILHNPPATHPDENRPRSTFTLPILIEMGDEGGENLKAIIKEKVRVHPCLPLVPVYPLPLDR